MHKAKVIRTIIESCRNPERQERQAPSAAGMRSPAAGGGLAGSVPARGARSRATAQVDPRLGQRLEKRRRRRRSRK